LQLEQRPPPWASGDTENRHHGHHNKLSSGAPYERIRGMRTRVRG
jgi:hypothetical protein